MARIHFGHLKHAAPMISRSNDQMSHNVPALALTVLAALGTIALGTLGSPAVSAEYDNPAMGDMACVALTRYVAEPTDRRTLDGSVVHRAEFGVANLCGRSVEVLACVGAAEVVEDQGANCFAGLLRPWSRSEIHTVEVSGPLAGPTIEWRWVRSAAAGM
jgi:hypothetical protein